MSEDKTTESYNRPNLNWICTNTEGCGCPGGPTRDGRCPGKSQCKPIRQNSRWKCSRSQVYGGSCEMGPDPSGNCCSQTIGCVPKRNLRSKRRIFVVCCVAVVTGILLLGIWKPNRTEFLAPGGLSANHAQIWSSGNSSNRCVACHAAGSANPISWLVDAVSGGSHIGQPQYQKCLACHEETLGADHALLVHNVSKQTISDVSIKRRDVASSKVRLFSSPVNHNGEIACAQCHQEHHGADHHLSAMTDTQCQSCHQSQFNSFESGHPEFTTVLTGNRTKIAFDHFSHQSKHFAATKQSFDCMSCHNGDQFGSVMQTKPFEQACASCHDQKIEASLSQGLAVFSLPILDSSLLKRNGLDVGQWPELADGGFDGSIPPLMKVLLSSDPRAENAMKFLGPEFDLYDIDETDSAHLKAAYQLAVATKSLIFDLSTNGQIGLANRLDKIAGGSISQSKLRNMLGSLSADTFIQAQKQWFPDLGEEIDIIKINDNDIPLEIADGKARQKKTFDVLLTAFVQEEQELAPNPLKGLFVPENRPTSISPNLKNPNPSAGPNSNSAILKASPNSPLIEFEDLPQVDSVLQKSATPSDQSKQPQTGRIENKFYRSPKTQGGDYPAANDQSSNAFNPRRSGNPSAESPTQKPKATDNSTTADTLAINPLAEKINSLNSKQVETEPSRSTKIENPYAQRNNPNPEQPMQLNIGSTDSQITDSKSPENPEPKPAIPSPQQPIQENELLAENPLKKLLADSQPKKSQATPTNVSPKLDRPDQSENKIAKTNSKESTPESNDLLPPATTSPTGPTTKKPLVADTNPIDKAAQEGANSTPPNVTKKPRKKIERLPANQMVALGGWYRDDATFTIAYRQAGHADSLTTNWYDFVSSIPNSKANPMYSDFNRLMTKSTSPGLCASCHSVDRQPDETLSFHWKTEYRDISTRDFTRFSHRPHLVQDKSDQCSTCHQILPGSNVMKNYLASDSTTLFDAKGCEAGFAPITKSTCVQCHNNRSKIQNCTQCHNYHVGSKVTLIKK